MHVNQLAKKLVTSLAVSLARNTECEGKKPEVERTNGGTTSVTMTPAVSSRESSCLASCSALRVSVLCRLFFLYSLFKKLPFVPVASATTAVRSDRRVLASNAPWTQIQQRVSRGQIRFR